MSNYWNVHCKTCEKYSESDFNRGDHIIRGIAKAYPHIQAALNADESRYLQVDIMAHGSELISFFSAHEGHDMEMIDEGRHAEPLEIPAEVKENNPLRFVSNVIELKPGHRYLLAIKGDVTMTQVQHAMEILRAQGIQGIGFALAKDVDLDVIEMPAEEQV